MPKLNGTGPNLRLTTVLKLLNWFADRKDGFQTLQLSGGEPLLYGGLFDVINAAKSLDYIVRLQSNGLSIKDLSHSDMRQLEAVRVKISVDGPSKKYHEIHREAGSFDKAVEGVSILLSNGITTGVKTVFTRHNIDAASAMVDFLSMLGARNFTYNLVEKTGLARTMGDICVTEYDVVRRIIGPLSKRKNWHLLNGTNILRWFLAGKRTVRDRLPWFIDYRGDVYRGQVFDKMIKVGNIYDYEWEELFTQRNPGTETLTCDHRSFNLIMRALSSFCSSGVSLH
jgi:MoaA/NifB/PqqE/SkfB family radical SAM enzyme